MASLRRHFCFCIPVRIGVFITSILLFLFAGGLGGGAFYLIYLINNDPKKLTDNNVNINPSKGWKIAIISFGVVFATVSIISLFGFIGSVIRNRRMVKAYAAMSWVSLILMTAATGAYLYAIYSKNGLMQCEKLTDNTVVCPQLSTGRKVVETVVNVVALLIQLYVCVIIGRYVEQLEDEQAYKNEFGLNNHSSSYYPHQPLDNTADSGLLHPQGGYPYTDQSHSFGRSN